MAMVVVRILVAIRDNLRAIVTAKIVKLIRTIIAVLVVVNGRGQGSAFGHTGSLSGTRQSGSGAVAQTL
ncbi:hypothetical protein R1flu_017748 [Riccia fluitans]|uniref:Uncharacterized protein n=1 Tax=Riccia fluitans TaxID=41844 RepID=A0ABD1ZDU5_9MARC